MKLRLTIGGGRSEGVDGYEGRKEEEEWMDARSLDRFTVLSLAVYIYVYITPRT